MRRLRLPVAAALAALALLLPATPAAARVGFFFGFGAPGFYTVPPFWYAPPPFYYAPPMPPAYYYPPYAYMPPLAPAPSSLSCRAGAWSCPVQQPARPGDACSCATARGPAWGRVGY